MRTIFLFLFALIGSMALEADTLDYYHVYYHGRKIGDFGEGHVIKVVIKSDSVRMKDTLFVNVFRDAGCSNCTYSMLIFGNKGPMMVDTSQHSQNFCVPFGPLLEYKFKTGTTEFNGYYTEYLDATRSRVISFKIILQGQ